MMRKPMLWLALILLIGITGCGQTTTDRSNTNASNQANVTESESTSTEISIVDFAGREVTFAEVPKNIVALSNGEMDIIYALGGKLVGRPTSRGPIPLKEAESVEQIGNTHEIDLEKLASLKPDVVLGNNPLNIKDIPAIEGLGSKMVLTSANSMDDIKKQIRLFGQLLQKEEKANEIIQTIDQKLEEIKKKQRTDKPRVLMVYGAPGTYMAALPNSLSGNILEMAGGENIAADFPSLKDYPQYAQLNTERIIEANPQIILLITHGDPAQVKEGFLKEMEQNAAWNGLDAVKNQRVEVLPSDLFGTNPGTRITEALDLLDNLLESLK